MGRGPDEDPAVLRGRGAQPARWLPPARRRADLVASRRGRAKVERLLNLMAALLETPRSAHRRGAPRAGPGLRRTATPASTGPSSATRTTSARWASRWRSSRSRPPTRPSTATASARATTTCATPARARRAGRAPPRGLGRPGRRHPRHRRVWKLGGWPSTRRPGSRARRAAVRPEPGRRLQGRRPAPTVRFRYHDDDRVVDPYRLDFQRGRWYLTGFDHVRGEERHFRLDRVDGELRRGRPRRSPTPDEHPRRPDSALGAR